MAGCSTASTVSSSTPPCSSTMPACSEGEHEARDHPGATGPWGCGPRARVELSREFEVAGWRHGVPTSRSSPTSAEVPRASPCWTGRRDRLAALCRHRPSFAAAGPAALARGRGRHRGVSPGRGPGLADYGRRPGGATWRGQQGDAGDGQGLMTAAARSWRRALPSTRAQAVLQCLQGTTGRCPPGAPHGLGRSPRGARGSSAPTTVEDALRHPPGRWGRRSPRLRDPHEQGPEIIGRDGLRSRARSNRRVVHRSPSSTTVEYVDGSIIPSSGWPTWGAHPVRADEPSARPGRD
jgi:hypothetical protein